jgi:L,D-transpeptidase-like protein
LTEPPTLFKIDCGRQVAGMMLAMTGKVLKLFLISLALALAILFFTPAVSRATDRSSSSPQTAVLLPPVPAQNQPASAATSVPVQISPTANAPHAATPVSAAGTPAAAAVSMPVSPASTPVAAATAAAYTTSPVSTSTPAAVPASSQARNSVSTVPTRAPPPASAATPVVPAAPTRAAGASAPGVSPAAFTVTTPNRQDHLNQDHLNPDGLRQNHLDQLDHHDVLEGQRLFNQTHELPFLDPANWSVRAYKSRYRLEVYYKGRLYTTYHAVFGRSLASGAKLWEGDRRTPEGAYHIVAKHPSARFRYFLRIDYPNDVDRVRFAELREDGKIPGYVREGGEIGIHGTDNPILNIANVNWTTGCISIDNSDIVALAELLPIGTLVVIKP